MSETQTPPTVRELLERVQREPIDISYTAGVCLLAARVEDVMSLDPLGWEQYSYEDCLAKVKRMLNGEQP